MQSDNQPIISTHDNVTVTFKTDANDGLLLFAGEIRPMSSALSWCRSGMEEAPPILSPTSEEALFSILMASSSSPFHLGDRGDFIYVALHNGGVSAGVSVGGGKWEDHVRFQRVHYNDSQWHSATLYRSMQEVRENGQEPFSRTTSLMVGDFSSRCDKVGGILFECKRLL